MINLYTKLKSLKLKFLIKNIYSLLRYDLGQELRNSQKELNNIQIELSKTQEELLYFKILNYYDNHPNQKYLDEISYLKELGSITVFPYRENKSIQGFVEAGFDYDKGMPFVVHNKNKKLYFPKSWSIDQAKATYINFIECENILGGDYSKKSPHQYQKGNFCVKKGDVVLDIGSAEALFSLDLIDIAKKIYIFESDKIWIEALKATFEPYQDKVIIINKLVSNIDSKDSVKLESCIKLGEIQSLFIKMDIEGYEKLVIEGNKTFLSKNINIKIACCTYHRQDDAECLEKIFNKLDYHTEYSDGYMIFKFDKDIRPPYFRKGIIRASN